jgi:hypothetical protein
MKSYDAIKNIRLFAALQSLTPEVVKNLQIEAEFNRFHPEYRRLGCRLAQFKRAVSHSVDIELIAKPQ